MPESKLHKVWYRSILPDGTLWCESSNAAEVVSMSEGKDVKFERMEVHIVHGDWEPWATPSVEITAP